MSTSPNIPQKKHNIYQYRGPVQPLMSPQSVLSGQVHASRKGPQRTAAGSSMTAQVVASLSLVLNLQK